MKRARYEVLTWDPETGRFTPQKGVRKGPYTLFGLRKALRQLREMGYAARRPDPSVLVERLSPSLTNAEIDRSALMPR